MSSTSAVQLCTEHVQDVALPADNQVAQRIEDSLGYCKLMALESLDHSTSVDIIETYTFVVSTCHNVILSMTHVNQVSITWLVFLIT